MSTNIIHPTALVAAGATLGDGVEIGAHAIIEDNVNIDDGCRIGSNVLIAAGARLGKNVKVHHGAVLATIPQDLKFGGEPSLLRVGDNTTIREYVTMNRGTVQRGETSVGSDCLLMAYSHVAHDCLIGNHVILANSVNLAGHIEIGDYAILGGLVPVHQFVKIGRHVMIGGGFRIPMDICPFAMCGGYPVKVMGLNVVGLRRRDFAQETLDVLDKAYRILFRSKLNTTQAVEKIKAEVELIPEVQEVLDFIAASERGICK
jgi:UDP-N-acetylglucosamine acyltransferase